MNEFDIIARFFAPLAAEGGAFGLLDDAAILRPRAGFDLVLTADQIEEGTDFFPGASAFLVAKKALRVNLSDLAAKGAMPAYYLLALSLPPGTDETWFGDFARGLKEDQTRFGISLLGGDTQRSVRSVAIAVTAIGFVPQGKMVRRLGARPGDGIFVTGTIGDSGGGLSLIRTHRQNESAPARALTQRYHLPEPPVGFGSRLGEWATAAIDVSDGLMADLAHLAEVSKVAMEIEAGSVPRSEALCEVFGSGPDAVLSAVTAGDDYQIAFTAGLDREPEIRAAAAQAEVNVSRIGRVKEGRGIRLLDRGHEIEVPEPGYRHF